MGKPALHHHSMHFVNFEAVMVQFRGFHDAQLDPLVEPFVGPGALQVGPELDVTVEMAVLPGCDFDLVHMQHFFSQVPCLEVEDNKAVGSFDVVGDFVRLHT